MSVENLVKDLSGLSVLELVDLIKELEEKWGVKASAPVAAGSSSSNAGPAVVEKSEFDIIIAVAPENKVQAIKVVKDSLNIGLAEAKALVDKGAGSCIKEKVSKADAEQLKKKLEEGGIKIELK